MGSTVVGVMDHTKTQGLSILEFNSPGGYGEIAFVITPDDVESPVIIPEPPCVDCDPVTPGCQPCEPEPPCTDCDVSIEVKVKTPKKGDKLIIIFE